ncbi:MAG: molybdopterin-dependent oxidoreductase [Bryobacteraceae bacterium]|nr:molybdopterin-dependent oxidoreductase [Bryobacteraceae bacterium]
MRERQSFSSRRTWLGMAAGGLLAPARIFAKTPEDAIIESKHPKMIVHSRRPANIETPVELLDAWITPVDRFYVRSHLYTPAVDAATWRCEVRGLLDNPLALTLDDLRNMPAVEAPVTLECAGNGRAAFRPRPLGTQWVRGAVGTARWRGVRLRDVLERARLKPAAKHIVFDGADTGIMKAADFIRSVPVEKCLQPDTILAYQMNGKPLETAHGFPLRLITPGWEGAASVKWLTTITAAAEEFDGPFMKRAYRIPVRPVEPGTAVDPKDTRVITSLAVKSVIVHPRSAAEARAGLIRGFAWAGENQAVKVEVSTDGGRTWNTADLGSDRAPYAWREFRYKWRPPGAAGVLMSRATDSQGNTQPMTPSWNPGGYLGNTVEPVSLDAEQDQRPRLTALPEGPGKQIWDRSCAVCHDASVVFNQRHDVNGWTRDIERMEGMGAQLSAGDKKTLAAYLAEHFPP